MEAYTVCVSALCVCVWIGKEKRETAHISIYLHVHLQGMLLHNWNGQERQKRKEKTSDLKERKEWLSTSHRSTWSTQDTPQSDVRKDTWHVLNDTADKEKLCPCIPYTFVEMVCWVLWNGYIKQRRRNRPVQLSLPFHFIVKGVQGRGRGKANGKRRNVDFLPSFSFPFLFPFLFPSLFLFSFLPPSLLPLFLPRGFLFTFTVDMCDSIEGRFCSTPTTVCFHGERKHGLFQRRPPWREICIF